MTAISRDEAQAHFGSFASFVSLDVPASSAVTQKELGWHPVQPGLIADLEEGHYFSNQPARRRPRPRPAATTAARSSRRA